MEQPSWQLARKYRLMCNFLCHHHPARLTVATRKLSDDSSHSHIQTINSPVFNVQSHSVRRRNASGKRADSVKVYKVNWIKNNSSQSFRALCVLHRQWLSKEAVKKILLYINRVYNSSVMNPWYEKCLELIFNQHKEKSATKTQSAMLEYEERARQKKNLFSMLKRIFNWRSKSVPMPPPPLRCI